jgi:hypothetical protein
MKQQSCKKCNKENLNSTCKYCLECDCDYCNVSPFCITLKDKTKSCKKCACQKCKIRVANYNGKTCKKCHCDFIFNLPCPFECVDNNKWEYNCKCTVDKKNQLMHMRISHVHLDSKE